MPFDAKRLIDYIAVTFGIDAGELGVDSPLFSSGLLDSFNMVDVVSFVESEFGIKFGILDLTLDNLDTIQSIDAYVTRRQAR